VPLDGSLLELSEAEQSVLDEAKAAAAPAPAPEPVAAAPVAEPTPEVPAAPAEVDETIRVNLDTAGNQHLPVPNMGVAEAPKFDERQAELDSRRDSLDKRYDDGEIEKDEYRRQTRALSREESALTTEIAEYRANAKAQAAFKQQAEQQAAQQWQSDWTDFLSTDRNKFIAGNKLTLASFQAAINAVEDKHAKDNKSPLSNSALLERARKFYIETMGIADPDAPKPPKVETPPVDNKPPKRPGIDPDVIPKTVSAAPNAGADPGGPDVIDELYASNIGDIEDRLARMNSSDLDRLLRKLPGAMQTGNLTE